MIFTISFLLLAFTLLVWQLWYKNSIAQKIGKTSLFFLATSLTSFVFTRPMEQAQYKLLFCALGILVLLSLFSMRFRFNKKGKIPYLLGSIAMLFLFLKIAFYTTNKPKFSVPEYLVEIDEKQKQSFLAYAKEANLNPIIAFDMSEKDQTTLDNFYIVDVHNHSSKDWKSTLEERPEVQYVEDNEHIPLPEYIDENEVRGNYPQLKFKDTHATKQWAIHHMDMNAVYELISKRTPKKKAKLFILDTGVDGNHEDLVPIFKATNPTNDHDKIGHGTHCAGIAGAMTGNHLGVSSFNPDLFEISSIKVLGQMGGTQTSVINGILKAADSGADVISLSLGGPSNDNRQKAYNEAVKYANDRGAIVVVAAGNSKRDAAEYSPANSKGVIAVGAIDEYGQKASFSNDINNIELGVFAPGVNILSTIPDNQYKNYSGTSMATPYVAGLITLMKCYQPKLNTKSAYQAIRATMSPMSEKHGSLNPGASLKEIIDKK